MNKYLLRTSIGLTASLLVLAGCSSSSKSSSAPNPPASTSVAATSASTTTAAASTTLNGPAYGNPGTTASSSAPAAAGITIRNFAYSGTLTVKAGSTVKVTNMDSAAHTLTDKATKKFDTGNIAGNGGTGTFTAPSTPGSYPFGCTYHPNMAGTLVVTS